MSKLVSQNPGLPAQPGTSVDQAHKVTIKLLGRFTLMGGLVADGALPAKARAVIAYLAAEDKVVPRQVLAELLWPEREETQSRQSLRQVILALRRISGAAGAELISSDAKSESIALNGATVDVAGFIALAKKGVADGWEAALALYDGPLLNGFPEISAPFDAWLQQKRAELEEIASNVMVKLAESNLQAGRPDIAVEIARRFVALDPLREDAHRLLMRAYAQAGRRGEALRQFARCGEIMREELHVPPDATTEALAADIRANKFEIAKPPPIDGQLHESEPTVGRFDDAADSTQPPAESKQEVDAGGLALLAIGATGKQFWKWKVPRLATAAAGLVMMAAAAAGFIRWYSLAEPQQTFALMPVKNISGDQRADKLAAIITSQLANGFSRLTGAHYLSNPSSLRGDWAAAHARYIITGTLQSTADTWNMEAKLVDRRTQTALWTALFTVQDEADQTSLGTELAALAGGAASIPLADIMDGGIVQSAADTEVRLLTQQARQFYVHQSPEHLRAFEAMLERALASDPNDVRVRAELGILRLEGGFNDWYSPAEKIEKLESAKGLFASVLKARPNHIQALYGMCVYWRAVGKYMNALAECGAVLQRDPWHTGTIKEAGLVKMKLGRFEEALDSFTLAHEYDYHTRSWAWFQEAGLVCLLLRKDREALDWLGKATQVLPGRAKTYALLAVAYERLGQHGEAERKFVQFRELAPDATFKQLFNEDSTVSSKFINSLEGLREPLLRLGFNG
jgi:DNA-binding SARP family transcriptional activator/TolB-like protein